MAKNRKSLISMPCAADIGLPAEIQYDIRNAIAHSKLLVDSIESR